MYKVVGIPLIALSNVFYDFHLYKIYNDIYIFLLYYQIQHYDHINQIGMQFLLFCSKFPHLMMKYYHIFLNIDLFHIVLYYNYLSFQCIYLYYFLYTLLLFPHYQNNIIYRIHIYVPQYHELQILQYYNFLYIYYQELYIHYRHNFLNKFLLFLGLIFAFLLA